jgi:hypothetical protein
MTCHLYPFRLNSSGTLVLHHTGFYLKHSTCDPCRGRGPRVIDAIFTSLVTMFGPVTAAYIRSEVDAGRDPVFEVPPDILAAWEQEDVWADEGTVPEPRNYAALRGEPDA